MGVQTTLDPMTAHGLQTGRLCIARPGNEIGVEGARAFADALKVNTSLTTLSISGKSVNYIHFSHL